MSKRTPGPWEVSEIGITNDGAVAVMSGKDEDRQRIGLVDCHTKYKRGEGWKTDCPVRKANARLIAVAPELLAMVENMVSFLESQGLNKSAQYIHGIELIIKARGE